MGTCQAAWPADKPSVAVQMDGWLTDSTKEMLRSVLNERVRVVVELGSWCGLSTRFICDHAPNAVVYAVDHWLGSAEHQGYEILPKLYETFLASCWDYRKQIVPVRQDTLAGIGCLAEQGIKAAVVYIDASHDYGSVKLDIAAARQAWPQAIIVGDDWSWAGVQQAVQEYPHASFGNAWVLTK